MPTASTKEVFNLQPTNGAKHGDVKALPQTPIDGRKANSYGKPFQFKFLQSLDTNDEGVHSFHQCIMMQILNRPYSRVKKKNSLLLCITIGAPFHPSETSLNLGGDEDEFVGKDKGVEPRRYEDYSEQLCNDTATQEDQDKAIPFIPFSRLRGRNGKQAREMKISDMDDPRVHRRKLRTKLIMLLVIQATLDPG